jgi:cytochrome c biogenesis protein CcmG/thiol:disulfide interchange protein DsbE
MKKQWIIVAAVLVLLTGGAVLGLRLTPDLFPVEVGSRAPQFHAVDLGTGDSVTMDRYKGQVVLINIWATWCEPCRVEMPSIQRLYQDLGPQGLKVASVSIDVADPSVVRRFAQEYGLTFPILQDRTRAIERIYQTTGVPETFVLSRDGIIVKKIAMAHSWDSPIEEDLIKRLLARARTE